MKYYKVKAQLAEAVTRRVPEVLQQYCRFDYENQYYSLKFHGEVGWYYTAKEGCAYDFATKFPDFKWIKVPSLWHDIGHWLIAKGAIAIEANDVIDEVLGDDCERRSPRWLVGPARNYIIRKGTNTVDQRLGEKRKIYEVE